MSRILVVPEQLRSLAGRLRHAAGDMRATNGRLDGSLGQLDWEARQRAGVDGQVACARGQADGLAGDLEALAHYLDYKARTFEDADREGVGSLQTITWPAIEIPEQQGIVAPFIIGGVIVIVAIPIIGIISDIVRDVSTAPSDAEQIDKAKDALRDVPGLKPEEWKKLSTKERLAALQRVEDELAKAQGRPPVPVHYEKMAKGENGHFDGTELHINEDVLTGGDLHKALSTVAHEGRHAYQQYAINHPGFHPDEKEVEAWGENLEPENYKRADKVGWKEYRNQPIEDDAFDYGDQFADAVAPQGVFREIGDEATDTIGRHTEGIQSTR